MNVKTATVKKYRELELVDASGNRREEKRHNMNRKADGKLLSVAQYIYDVIPECCELEKDAFLSKTLRLEKCAPLQQIMLLYDVENRFAAISYNLLLQTFLPAKEDRDYQFVLRYEGVVWIRDAVFSSTCGKEGKRSRELLEGLNEPIILKKIQELNLLQVLLQYSLKEERWTISIKSMVGSATWILIPPVMHVVMPKRREAYGLLEVMRMLVSVVSNSKK